jgi:hypothetical protein
MATDRELYRIVDFILNRATADQLRVVRAALDRRAKDNSYRLSSGNIRGMARSLSDSLAGSLDTMGQIKDMTRNFVRELVHRQIPDIPEEHLDLLLDEWIPERAQGPTEESLPPDVLHAMVVQFVDFSLGRMSPEFRAELAEGWQKRYWSVFSEQTRSLIREFLLGSLSESDFWRAIQGDSEE